VGAISLPKQIVAMIQFSEDGDWLGFQFLNFESLGIPTAAKPCWTDLCDLVFRQYLYRIWIIQEVLTNRSCVFRCGSRIIERDGMPNLGAILTNFYNLRDNLLVSVRWTVPNLNIFPLWCLKRHFDKGDTFTLNNLLAFTIPYKATNLKDRIFALVSFARDVDASFVDYKQDLSEGLTKTAKLGLRDSSFANVPLDLLSHAGHNEAVQDVPSWVSSWAIGIILRVQKCVPFDSRILKKYIELEKDKTLVLSCIHLIHYYNYIIKTPSPSMYFSFRNKRIIVTISLRHAGQHPYQA
jgi:hypothetical protein